MYGTRMRVWVLLPFRMEEKTLLLDGTLRTQNDREGLEKAEKAVLFWNEGF